MGVLVSSMKKLLQPNSILMVFVISLFVALVLFSISDESAMSTVYAVGDYVPDPRMAGVKPDP